MEIHYTKHHQSYVNQLNQALEGHPVFNSMPIDELLRSWDQLPRDLRCAVRDNGGGHANHTLFWSIMGPDCDPDCGREPTGALADAIDATFDSFQQLKRAFTAAALDCFGSGWAWLTIDASHQLAVECTPNQECPLMEGRKPLLGIDVWEHAYYLEYQNRRADYIDAWWHVVNWANVAKWYADDSTWSDPFVGLETQRSPTR